MKVQFANGLTIDADNIDDAIAKCIASGNDPFNPTVIQEISQNKKIKQQNADTVEQ